MEVHAHTHILTSRLKNSSGLRLFKNNELVKLITEYDQAINYEAARTDDNQYTRDEQTRCFRQVFNYTILTKIEKLLNQHAASRDSVLNLKMPLLNRHEKSLSDLSYAIGFTFIICREE
jgi:hypothetical protein